MDLYFHSANKCIGFLNVLLLYLALLIGLASEHGTHVVTQSLFTVTVLKFLVLFSPSMCFVIEVNYY